MSSNAHERHELFTSSGVRSSETLSRLSRSVTSDKLGHAPQLPPLRAKNNSQQLFFLLRGGSPQTRHFLSLVTKWDKCDKPQQELLALTWKLCRLGARQSCSLEQREKTKKPSRRQPPSEGMGRTIQESYREAV